MVPARMGSPYPSIDLVVGQRVGSEAELGGLDLPEMGALCYPEFELKAGA